MRARWIVVTSLLVCGSFGSHASAQPGDTIEPGRASPEALVREGIEARRVQDDARALELFRRAHEIAGSAEALVQMALAEQALGRWVDAYRHLRAALEAPDPWVESHLEALRGAMQTIDARVARVTVECNVEGARLAVDGSPVGTLPLAEPVLVPAGPIVLDVEADGYLARRQQEDVPGATLTRLSIRLAPDRDEADDRGRVRIETNVERGEVWANGTRVATLPLSEPLALPPGPIELEVRAEGYLAARHTIEIVGGTTTALVVSLETASTGGATVPAQTGPGPLIIAGTVLLGASALGLIGALAAVGVREDNVLTWNDDAQCPERGDEGRLSMCASIYAAWRSAEDWAIGLAIGAGGLAAASLVLLLIGLDEERSGDTAVGASVAPGGGYLELRRRF